VDPYTFITADFSAADQGGEIVPAVVKAQVLLDRTNISSGEIDGKYSPRLDEAIRAFAEIHNMPADTKWSRAFWDELTSEAIVPVLTNYTITSDDLKGPFLQLPDRLEDMTSFRSLGYASVREALAERFHMSPELLSSLNPDATFSVAGEEIVVANVLGETRSPKAARLEVDKDRQTVKVYSSRDELIASFPASVGSEEKPTPSGTLKVRSVNSDPSFHYNPKYQFKEIESQKPFELAPGPNSPLGTTWIALSKPSYGIHGTAEPSMIGKAASHGCVRLTNWDAQRLSAMVSRGVPVSFIDKPDIRFVAY
jgi:lipoprotein-anchoring transpeptidase ErfK/SrfK